MWYRVIWSLGLILAWSLLGTSAQASHCGGITDMYLLAQCEASHTSGTAAPGMMQSTIGTLPQYSGSPTCQTAGCSGATQEGYFTTSGDVSTLNNDGASAAVTDPRMGQLQTTRTNVQGWDLTTSAPVVTSNAVASTLTPSGITQTCTNVQVCIAWTQAAPSTQTCTMPGSAVSNCTITDTPSMRSVTVTGTLPGNSVWWGTPHEVFLFFNRQSPGNYLVSEWNGGYYSDLASFTVDESFIQPNETIYALTGSALISVENFGGCDYPSGGWYEFSIGLTNAPFNPWCCRTDIYNCPAPGDQSGYARALSYTLVLELRADTVVDGCSGQRAMMTLISSTCTDGAPRTVIDPFTSASYTLTPTAAAPASSCWGRNEQYGYQGTAPDTCSALLQQGCSQTSSTCTVTVPGGCDTYTNTLSCPGGSVCATQTTVQQCTTCGAPTSSVPFCVDASSPPNTNLANAATWLAMLDSIKNDWDPTHLRIFTGKRMTCDYDTVGQVIVNCCDTDPTMLLGNCSDEEVQLAKDRQAKKAHYVGTHCVTTGPLGLCLRKEQVYCDYNSELARMIQDQGRPQLGLNWGTADVPDCEGFTVAQFTSINWSSIDFSEWYANVAASIDPVALTNSMSIKICTATGQC